MNKFKDKCDICNNFNYLISYKNICICKKCLANKGITKNKKVFQLSLIKEYERKL